MSIKQASRDFYWTVVYASDKNWIASGKHFRRARANVMCHKIHNKLEPDQLTRAGAWLMAVELYIRDQTCLSNS